MEPRKGTGELQHRHVAGHRCGFEAGHACPAARALKAVGEAGKDVKGRQYKFSKSAILHRVRKGPVKLLELAQGSRNPGVRKRLMRHINALEQAGTIKKVWIQGFPHYVKSLHETTDDDRVRMLRENCRPIDGCMAWASHVDPLRGPIGRVDGPALNVRRFIWRVTRGEIGRDQIIRMRPECEHGCIEYTHMRIGKRNETRRGAKLLPPHRQAMATAVRARLGKLDWDKAREIRASGEPRQALAERYGVSRSLIGMVLRHEVWVEAGGMFTGLLRAAA